GVAPELPGAMARQIFQQPQQLTLAQTTGVEKSQKAIDGTPLATPGAATQRVHYQCQGNPPGRRVADLPEHPRLMGQANRGNPELAAQLVDDIEHGGQQMHVLMAVQVAGREAGAQNPPALLGELPSDVAKIDPTGEVAQHEPVSVAQKPAIRTDQRWDLVSWKKRSLLDQREVDADIECGNPARELR